MPLAKLHLSSDTPAEDCRRLADQLRSVIVETLDLPPAFGKVLVYTTPAEFRSVHPSRDPNMVFVELHLFKGRSPETKSDLLQKMSQAVSQHVQVSDDNIFIHIIEGERGNWGIRGGLRADQVDLGY